MSRWRAPVLRSRAGLVGAALLAHALIATVGAATAEGVQSSFGACALFTCVALSDGLVAADVRSGRALLRLQKPVRPVALYTALWLRRVVVAAGLVAGTAVFTLVALAARSLGGVDATLAGLPALALLCTSVSCVAFGVSGWGLAPESLLVVGVAALSLAFALAPGATGPAEPFLQVLAVPFDDIQTVVRSGSDVLTAPALRVALHLAAWTLIGLAGTSVTTRSPLPSG